MVNDFRGTMTALVTALVVECSFLVNGNDDKGVPPENSIFFYLALRKAKVPAEMHIYENGRHGFGLGKNFGPVSTWPTRCQDWMKNRGLLDKKK